MKTAMENLKEMVDVNTIVGDPVETQDGTVIVPVSRVSFGFAAGGAEYDTVLYGEPPGAATKAGGATGGGAAGGAAGGAGRNGGGSPGFGGGSGGGVTIHPVGFLVVGQGTVRLLPVDGRAVLDRLIDLVPGIIDRLMGPEESKAKAGGTGEPEVAKG
jgi:sporulation protein YtfJ